MYRIYQINVVPLSAPLPPKRKMEKKKILKSQLHHAVVTIEHGCQSEFFLEIVSDCFSHIVLAQCFAILNQVLTVFSVFFV